MQYIKTQGYNMELFWYTWFCLLLFCSKAFCNNGTLFNVLANKYDTVILECPNTFPGYPVWLIPVDIGLVTYSVGSHISTKFKNENCIRLVGNHMNGEYNLQISNITKKYIGPFKCQRVVDGKLTEYSFHLNILEKPKVYDTDVQKEHKTRVGKPLTISIQIETLQPPIVSWLGTTGGTTGDWKVVQKGRGNYTISSTIIPKTQMHFGHYSLSVRNDAGSITITINLSQKESPIAVSPSRVLCDSSSETTVVCLIDAKNPLEWTNSWVQSRNGQFIQRLTGLVKNNTSSISIKFCDYREEGDYKCLWEKAFHSYSAKAVVVVKGPPVITRTDIHLNANCFCLETYLYTYGYTVDVIWYARNKIIHKSSSNNITLRSSTIQLSYLGRTIHEKGFVTSLCFSDCQMTAIHVYSCHVQSIYGRKEFTFDEQSINNVFRRLKQQKTTLQTENLDYNITNERGKSSSTDSFARLTFLYTLVPLGIIIVTLGIVSGVVHFRHKYDSAG